jgi:uncharacterized protein YraI
VNTAREKCGRQTAWLNSVCIQENAWKASRVTNKTFRQNNQPSGRETNPDRIQIRAVKLTTQQRIQDVGISQNSLKLPKNF